METKKKRKMYRDGEMRQEKKYVRQKAIRSAAVVEGKACQIENA